jgi:hypothetical protein
MKKIILGVAALIGACSMADANTLTVHNNTNCTYDLSIGGIGNGGGFTVAVPGTSTFNSNFPSTGIFGVKVMYADVNGSLSQIYVGDNLPFANSTALPAPSCPTPFNFITAVWQTAPNGDVTLTIL